MEICVFCLFAFYFILFILRSALYTPLHEISGVSLWQCEVRNDRLDVLQQYDLSSSLFVFRSSRLLFVLVAETIAAGAQP